MGRLKSPLRVKRRAKGFEYQPRDKERLRYITRWYAVTPMHLLRREEEPLLWHPLVHQWKGDQEAREKQLLTRLNGVRRRMLIMRRVQPHPPVGSAMASATTIGYYATQHGAAMVSPWENIRRAAFQNLAHAFMAADIGRHLESSGFPVFSEREIATGQTVMGRRINHPVQSEYNGGDGRALIKTPDLVIPSKSTLNFIAVEIERDENRPLRVYRDKLLAYQSNPNIQKVWYCYREGTNTGARVKEAATALWGDDYINLVRLVPCALRRGKPLPEDWDDADAIRAEDFYEMGASDTTENVAILTEVMKDLEALK